MRSSAMILSIPSEERSDATRALPRLASILPWMTDSSWPKSVVTSMLNVVDSLAISASASLILSSASYFWMRSRTSASFLLACWIFLRLF